MATAMLIAPTERELPAADLADARTCTCPECGYELRIFGAGHHRDHFKTDAQRLNDPVMNGGCPACGHRLPGRGGGSH